MLKTNPPRPESEPGVIHKDLVVGNMYRNISTTYAWHGRREPGPDLTETTLHGTGPMEGPVLLIEIVPFTENAQYMLYVFLYKDQYMSYAVESFRESNFAEML